MREPTRKRQLFTTTIRTCCLRAVVAGFSSLALCNLCQADLVCPSQPQQTARDVTSDVDAAVARSGPIKAGQIKVNTKVEVNNLMAKYPNANILYVVQLLGATLCQFLANSHLDEKERLDRWSAFQIETFQLIKQSAQPSESSAK